MWNPCVFSCEDESIDELAAFLGVGEQVAALTAK
jgi:phosphoserine phosphatase